MLQQAAIAVVDTEKYQQLHTLIEAAFSDRDVEVFLDRVSRSKIGIRNFEKILERGWIGPQAASLFQSLPVSDQALTRERYLQLVEAISPELRFRYRKAYTLY